MAEEQVSATPHFKNPPVVETVLGVQFAPLKKMRITHYGLLLPCLGDVFPTGNERLTEVSEQLPLDPVIEIFETNMSQSAALRWSVSKAPPFPRCWYASENKQFLAQVQPDRFIFNWRQPDPSGEYPRYTSNLDRFIQLYTAFLEFVRSEALGTVEPTQCEVTYVNHIDLPQGSNAAQTLDLVLTGWRLATSDDWLTGGERGEFVASYVMPKSAGRLHVKARSVIRRKDDQEIIRLDLTARGTPSEHDVDGVRAWLDRGHEWVVRGFASITTPEMHKRWGRIT